MIIDRLVISITITKIFIKNKTKQIKKMIFNIVFPLILRDYSYI